MVSGRLHQPKKVVSLIKYVNIPLWVEYPIHGRGQLQFSGNKMKAVNPYFL